MFEGKYDIETLRNAIIVFRDAILSSCRHNDFDCRDRMSNFPIGCCDDACDLLAYYLFDKFRIQTRQGNGIYDDGIFDNLTNHAWLIMDDGTIIDITGIQFKYCAGFYEEVYIGQENSFYKALDRKTIADNCNIKYNERLWNDYLVIMKYINLD